MQTRKPQSLRAFPADIVSARSFGKPTEVIRTAGGTIKRSRPYRHLLLLLLLSCVLLFGHTSALAASVRSKALAAYRTWLEKQPARETFAVIYLNNDSVPELLASYGRVYTWKKSGGMKLLMDDYEYDFKKYYKKKNVLLSKIILGGIIGEQPWYYSRMKGNKMVTICHKSLQDGTGKWIYYNSKFKKISASKFRKTLKKYYGSKKAVNIKFHKNTAANRKKYLK